MIAKPTFRIQLTSTQIPTCKWCWLVASTSFNRRSKNAIVEPIIVLKLALRNVEQQIFAANLMVAANDAALEHAPEADAAKLTQQVILPGNGKGLI